MSSQEPPAGHPGTEQDELSGRYVVGRLLGRGGMGEVRLAEDQRLLRQVAVKTLLERDPESEARFLREAQITGKLTHPNVPPIHDLGSGPTGVLFFTMRALPGRDLAQILKEDGALPISAGLQLFTKICDAVGYAHSRAILHRDLKPANVVVGEYGEVYVIDWGLAKPFSVDGAPADEADPHSGDLTEAGEVLGTPAYMSPEHASGGMLDARSDIYALGAILYAILTGRKPFEGKGYQALMRAFKGQFERPRRVRREIPWEVEQIVLRAMALERERRYPDVASMLADVEAWREGRVLPGIRYPLWRRVGRAVARYSGPLALAGVLGGALGTLLLVALVFYAVTLVMARDRALDAEREALAAEREAEARALEQQVALARMRARTGMPGIARRDLDDAASRSLALGLDPRPAQLAASELDMRYPPPEVRVVGPAAPVIAPSGDRVAWIAGRDLVVHDLLSGQLVLRRELPGGGSLRLDRQSEEGIRVLELEAGRLRALDGESGERLWEMPLEVDHLGRVTLSGDGSRAAVQDGGEVRFLSVPDGAEVGPARTGTLQQWSTDGERVSLALAEGGPHRQVERVQVVEVESGRVVGDLLGAERYAMSDDLELGVRGTGGALEGVRLDGSIAWRAGTSRSPVFRTPDEQVAVLADIGRLELRDLWTGELRAARSLGSPPSPATGGLQVGGGWVGSRDRSSFRIWSLSEQPSEWTAHAGAGLWVNLSPDGVLAATSGWEGDLAIWDWRARRELWRIRVSERGVRSAAFSPDGRRVATADREGVVRVLDLVDGTLGAALDADRGIAMAVQWVSPADVVALYEDGALLVWDVERGVPSATLQDELRTGWTLEVEGDRLVVSGRDGADPIGELWDLSARRRLASIPEQDVAYGAALTGDGSAWAVGRSDGVIVLVDAGTQAELTPSVDHGPAMALDFTEEGDVLAVGCFDGRVVLFDRASHRELHTLDALDGPVQHLGFAPGTRSLLITGEQPGVVRLFDLDRASRAEETVLELEIGSETAAPDWLRAASRAELRGDWKRAAVALEAAAALDREVDPIRRVRALAMSDRLDEARRVLAEVDGEDGTAGAWRRSLEVDER